MGTKWPSFDSLKHAFGPVVGQALLKSTPADFIVEELLHEPLTEQGEHVYLYIMKENQNTAWVARKLSEITGVSLRDISYAGLKDRHAQTRQWFSLKWPIKKAFPDIQHPDFTVETVSRHERKLKRGAFLGNRFKIRLNQVEGHPILLERRLAQINKYGVPNYFGLQRFGREQGNLDKVLAFFEGDYKPRDKNERSILISSARSFLFNAYLSNLLTEHQWPIKDISYGLLWGKEGNRVVHQRDELAEKVAGQYTKLSYGLECLGVELDFRPISLQPVDMSWQLRSSCTLDVQFSLPPGSFATIVLRELVDLIQEQ